VKGLSGHGIMKLSRHVVSVSFRAWQDGSKAVEEEVAFTPAIAGRSYRALHFGSCKMEVLVAWGLFSSRKFLENVTIVILLLFDKKYLIKAN
jgi:hypothetical protein